MVLPAPIALPIPPPEIPREQNNDGEEFQTAGDHQGAQEQFHAGIIEVEASGGDGMGDGGAGVRQHGNGRCKIGLHIKALYGQDQTGEDDQSAVGQKKDGDVRDDRGGDCASAKLDRDDRARMEPADTVSGDQPDHDQDTYDLDGAGGGCRAASDDHQGQKYELTGDRPDQASRLHIACCAGHA